MAEHNELGKKGEETAVKFLTEKGFQILERNFRFGKGEIDIVARDSAGKMRFVEVKARLDFDRPEEAVNSKKINLLINTGIEYKLKHKIEEETFLDIVAINFHKDKAPEIDYFEDVWV